MKVSEDYLTRAKVHFYAAFKTVENENGTATVISDLHDGVDDILTCSMTEDGAVLEMLRYLSKKGQLTDEDRNMTFSMIDITVKSKDVRDKLADYFEEESNGLITIRLGELYRDFMAPAIEEANQNNWFGSYSFFGKREDDSFNGLLGLARAGIDFSASIRKMQMTHFECYEDSMGRINFSSIEYSKFKNPLASCLSF